MQKRADCYGLSAGDNRKIIWFITSKTPVSQFSSDSLRFLPSSLFSSKCKEEDKPLKTKTIAWIKRRGKNKSYSGGVVNF